MLPAGVAFADVPDAIPIPSRISLASRPRPARAQDYCTVNVPPAVLPAAVVTAIAPLLAPLGTTKAI